MSMRYPGGLIAPTPVNQQYPSGVWTGPQSAPYQANNVWGNDPYFKNTSLLLQAQGPAAPFIKDSSVNNFNLTISGNTRSDNRTPFIENGYWSNYFDGSGDYLQVSHNAALDLGSGDFTVEFWLNTPSWSSGTAGVVGKKLSDSTNGWQIYRDSGQPTKLNGRLGQQNNFFTTSSVTTNVWEHWALVRTGTTLYWFKNGVLDATGSSSLNVADATASLNIAYADTWSAYGNFYLSNLRIVKGTAVYTSNFTPSTTPLTAITNTSLLTCQSNRFVDNSANNFTITRNGDAAVSMQQPFTAPSGTSLYGSGYFDGTGDYLTIDNSAFAFGSNSFTVELWVYPTTVSQVQYLVDTRDPSSTTSAGFQWFVSASAKFGVYVGTTAVITASTSSLSANAWTHLALVKNGSTWTIYINGTADATTGTNSTSLTTGFMTIGCSCNQRANTTTDKLNGYISNNRVVNGTAVYTTGFTTPTSPLAGIANTSLLTLQSNVPVNNNVFFDSSPNNYAITRTGSINQGSFTPYNAGYYSNYFDGSGDYLTAPASSAYAFGTSALTIEMWVYMTAYPASYSVLVSNRPYNSGNTTSWFTGLFSTGVFRFSDSLGSVNIDSPAGAVPLNAWTHLAAVRTSTGTNGVSLYINGVVVAQGTCNLNFSTTTNGLVMGTSYDPSNYYITGFVSNLRIVNGTAVYTSAFTPSTTPLTAIANTVFLTCQSNRLIDNSTNNFTITKVGDVNVQAFDPFPPSLQYTTSSFSGSGYFFGASNSLATPSGTCPVINDFSASGWVYRTSVPGYQQTFFAMGLDGSGRIGFFWTGSNFEYNIYGSSTVTIDGSGSMPVGAWTYVVVTRTGSTLTLYYNGTLKATVTLSGSFSAASGRAMSWMDGTIGYATNLRFDTAAYSSPTTVPTAPVSYTANTNNLLNFTNAGIFDNAMQNALVTVGDAKLNTAVTKYGTGSMYFDGSGDYLSMLATPNLTFGSGDWTVECWIYLPSLSSTYYAIASQRTGDTLSTIGWTLFVNASKIETNCSNGSSSVTAQNTTVLTTNTWYHVAAVRSGNNLITYVNGIGSTPASFTGSVVVAGSTTYVGFASGSAITAFSGYIDDLRITKGVARYVGNFTPPVARMPNQ